MLFRVKTLSYLPQLDCIRIRPDLKEKLYHLYREKVWHAQCFQQPRRYQNLKDRGLETRNRSEVWTIPRIRRCAFGEQHFDIELPAQG